MFSFFKVRFYFLVLEYIVIILTMHFLLYVSYSSHFKIIIKVFDQSLVKINILYEIYI